MAPTFFFALGSRPARRDLDVALAVGQRHFLVPVGSTAIPWLRGLPETQVALDSAAWPPGNPDRPTMEEYADAICSWRAPDGSWGTLAWAAAYDTIGDLEQTRRDGARLLALLRDRGAADAPIVLSIQHPDDAGAIVRDDLGRAPEVAGDDRARYGLGGLVPMLSPTRPLGAHLAADAWVERVLDDLADLIGAGVDPARLGLHLFGIGRPGFVLRSPLVVSFDSSGPAQMASAGWPRIAPRYTPAYGISIEKLQTSREARLAYWICDYAARNGCPYTPICDETILTDDRQRPRVIQLGLGLELAAERVKVVAR